MSGGFENKAYKKDATASFLFLRWFHAGFLPQIMRYFHKLCKIVLYKDLGFKANISKNLEIRVGVWYNKT